MAYYIVYDEATGRAYAWTSTPPVKLLPGLAFVELPAYPGDGKVWDPVARQVVDRPPPPPLRDRIAEFKADIQTIYASRLTAAQRAQVDAALVSRFGDVKQVP